MTDNLSDNSTNQFFDQPDQPAQSLLIVDEYNVGLQQLQEMFSDDFQVLIANSPDAALNLCISRFPDLVLIDVDAPSLDGLALCKKIKENRMTASTPVVFLTTKSDEEAELCALDAGAIDFIARPFQSRVIQLRIKAHMALQSQHQQLKKMTFIDGLTGLYNRRFFDDRIESEFHRSRRTGSFLSILLINIDDFKAYNDHYGHPAGDDCLIRIAHCIKKSCKRPGDLVARFSGTELVCLLPDTSVLNAFPFAQDLEKRVRELAIEHGNSSVSDVATISLGVVSRTGLDEADVFIELAKIALQNAKDQGRARAWCALD
jgi:diguanylate cyclase (GGDEF)-like protein